MPVTMVTVNDAAQAIETRIYIGDDKNNCRMPVTMVTVNDAAQAIETKTDIGDDLRDEVLLTLSILKRLDKPQPPSIEGTCKFIVLLSE